MKHPTRREMEAKATRSLWRNRFAKTFMAIDIWICGFKAGREHQRKEHSNATKA